MADKVAQTHIHREDGNEDYCHIDERLNAVDAAIRAALEGAI